jgi:hypothetical protein
LAFHAISFSHADEIGRKTIKERKSQSASV